MTLESLQVVLLDVDGTLIDSNDAHAQSWVEACGEYGYEVAFDDVRRMIGMGGDKVLPRLTGLEEASTEGEKIGERRGSIFREKYLPSLAPFPHARELLERMRSDGFELVIASSASEEDLGLLLRQAAVADLVPMRTSSDDAEESKPAPDIIEAALKKSDAQPARAVMIGDTPYDAGAARRAGVDFIAFRCGGWDDAALAGAVEIYDAPADLLTRYDESAIGRAALRKKSGVIRKES